MKALIMSDLHLEFDGAWFTPPVEGYDIVILAGDIGYLKNWGFVRTLMEFFNVPVLFVPGNHDFYKAEFNDYWEKPDWMPKHVHYLHNNSVEIDGIKFVGSVLWSNVDYHGFTKISDTYQIKYNGTMFNVNNYQKEHKKAVEYLENQEADVVITHFPPTRMAQHPHYEPNEVTDYFINNLDWLVRKISPKWWISGHTHYDFDYWCGDTRVISSQKGYPNELGGYKPRIIEI